MESLLSFFRMHWDHEPKRLLSRPPGTLSSAPSGGEGRGEEVPIRFMESPHDFDAVHWCHQPADRAVASWTAPVLWRFWLARLHCQSARGLVLRCFRWERALGIRAVH